MQTSFYGEVLTEHFTHPRHEGIMTQVDRCERGSNPSCGDSLQLQMKIDGDQIAQLQFTGEGCALSRAAADIVCELLVGKTIVQAREIIAAFEVMLAGQLDERGRVLLGEAVALEAATAMPLRTKCVQLAWQCAAKMLEEGEKK